MKMRAIKLIACLTGIILIYCSFIFPAGPKIKPESAFSLNSSEIILLFNKHVDDNDIHYIKNAPMELEILEYIDDYMLISAKNNCLDGSIDYLSRLYFVSVAELNQEIELNYTADSVQYINKIKNIVMPVPDKASSKEVIVAVLDTGIDYTHPDLSQHMWINKNEIAVDGIDNDSNGYIDDIYGWDFYNDTASVYSYILNEDGVPVADNKDNDNHGTHCAGIIKEISNAAANNVKIMSLKIHGGKDGKGSISNAVKAIKYATIMGADICNMSWGTTIYSEALEQVMRESNMLFVAAAGNEGKNIDEYPLYPACFDLDNLIVATFTNSEGKLTHESNYSINHVDIAVPGIDIKSTIVGSYGVMSGSSMSSAYVTGAAAILYVNGENIYPSDVKKVLMSSLKPNPNTEGYVKYPGSITPDTLYKYRSSLEKDITSPVLELSTIYDMETLLIELKTDDFGESGVRVIKYAAGNKLLEDFKKGTAGTSVRNNVIALSKSGLYTFYISDYAGNENIYYYTVAEDTSPPDISTTYSATSNKNFYTVTAKIYDDKSGVKLVKYMEGKKKSSDFRSAANGTIIESTDSINYIFTIEKAGKYTIYALDYRGNSSVYIIDLPDIVVESFYITDYGQILTVGSRYLLNYNFAPYGAKDTVTFKSSKPSVATVNRLGMVTALSPGLTTITATTSQGLTSQCLIFVTYNSLKLIRNK